MCWRRSFALKHLCVLLYLCGCVHLVPSPDLENSQLLFLYTSDPFSLSSAFETPSIHLTCSSRVRSFSKYQIRSVAQSCPTFCDPMNHSTPGLPVHHQLPEFTQTHVHQVRDSIQPSHPLSSPSPLAPNPSQHQTLFH